MRAVFTATWSLDKWVREIHGKQFVRSKHFDLQNLLPKLEGCRAHGIFLNVPAVLGWDHSLLASKKKRLGGQCSWVLKKPLENLIRKSRARSSSLATQWSFIVIGLQAFFILKTSLLKCQLHSTKNPQVASGFYGFLLAASEFSLWLSHSLASELDDPELPPERGEEAITSIHLGGIPPSGIMESQKKRLWQLD